MIVREKNRLKIIIWGTGKVATEVLENLSTLSTYDILGFIDNNQKKAGKIFFGKEVFLPNVLKEILVDKIVVLTDAYPEICEQISNEYPNLLNKVEDRNFFIKQSILKRYEHSKDKEILEIVDYINKNGLKIFNYDFSDKYEDIEIPVFWDKTYKLYYVLHNGKKMYFSRKFNTEESVRSYYSFILMEQDEKSPHRYLTTDFNVEEEDIVVDAGVAEGNFALDIIDKAKKIYLIEADEEWIEALQVTFKDYKEKVIIIKAFLGSYDEGDIACLDTLIKEPINFLKMDIEGSEWDALCGAKGIIKNSPKMKVVACTYHSDYDLTLLEYFMKQNDFEYKTSSGYIWFPFKVKQVEVSTRLNRVLIKGRLK